MWSTAKAWGCVTDNVMEGVVPPHRKRRQRFFASQQQIQLIVAAAEDIAMSPCAGRVSRFIERVGNLPLRFSKVERAISNSFVCISRAPNHTGVNSSTFISSKADKSLTASSTRRVIGNHLKPTWTVSAFGGTNPTDESITS